ncbi:MAG: endonuclease III [Phycisphaerae bacterium]|nr:endonuclease III [Phycisphaerae bacterium]
MARTAATSKPADRATVDRARRIYRKLARAHPDAHCALDHQGPYQLLAATILSAQCTDQRVNMVTPALFKKYPTAAEMARARPASVEKIIRSTGFFRSKAKSLIESARGITERFGGSVPDQMDDLLSLRGVARKTANVVLGNAFNRNVGVVVDTHIKRLAQRMGLTTATTPQKIEPDLMALFPRRNWCMLAHLLIWHGRRHCSARKPDCDHCPIRSDCPQIGVKS